MKKCFGIIFLFISLIISDESPVSSYSTPGLWSKDLYFRRMDFSSNSLRERAMGGSGIVSSNSAGALFTNSAQLVRMEGSEIGVSFDLGYSTESIDKGYFEQFEESVIPRYTDANGYYRMKKFITVFAPKARNGQLAFALYTGNSKVSDPINLYIKNHGSGEIVKTGEYFTDNSFEIGLTSGYGHDLPSTREVYTHSLGLTVDLNFQYQPNFGNAIVGLQRNYILGYLGEWYAGRRGALSLGVTGGRVANPTNTNLNRFEYAVGLGWSSAEQSSSSDGPLDFSFEGGLRQDLYKRDSKVRGFPNPYGGVELTIIDMFALRTGIRRDKKEIDTSKLLVTIQESDGSYSFDLVPVDVSNELGFSYGIGFTPFRILTFDFAVRTFLRSELRKGESQYAFDFRFHW